MIKRALVWVAIAVVAGGLAGCSSSGGITCADYGAKDFSEQTNVIMRMIQDHGLDPASNVVGAAQVGVDVNSFCGLSGLPGSNSKPTKNQSISIEKAVDWDSYRKN